MVLKFLLKKLLKWKEARCVLMDKFFMRGSLLSGGGSG